MRTHDRGRIENFDITKIQHCEIMETKNKKQEQATILDGVMLTESTIRCLRTLQDDDNCYLREAREYINEAISELIFGIEYMSEREPDILRIVKYLNDFNRDIKRLMKP